MAIDTRLKNCRIIIKAISQNSTLADTVITSCDWQTNTVRIDSLHLPDSRRMGDVLVLIFEREGLYEYRGKLGSVNISNEKEIRLYQGRERESRLNSRYDFRTAGAVLCIKIKKQQIMLRKPIPISTVNISSSGLLIQAMSESFRPRDEVEIDITMGDRQMKLECQIVRTQNNNLWTEEYGCRIISTHL